MTDFEIPEPAPPQIAKRIIFSYVVDWLCAIIAICIAGSLSYLTPITRPFSPNNPDISYPWTEHEHIPNTLLMMITWIIPGGIILVLSMGVIPYALHRPTQSWRARLWELNVGWLGLALSVGSAMLLTDSMKNIFGKTRPDFLSRCRPDPALYDQYHVGDTNIEKLALNYLVTWEVCSTLKTGFLTKTDGLKIMREGFRSFPSGHSSMSFAGETYLAFWLARKLHIHFPFTVKPHTTAHPSTVSWSSPYPNPHSALIDDRPGTPPAATHSYHHTTTASQPLFLFFIPTLPLLIAMYVSATRYSDFRHQGFDILFGVLMGITSAYIAVNWYHAPNRPYRWGGAWDGRKAFDAWGGGLVVGRLHPKKSDEENPRAGTHAEIVDEQQVRRGEPSLRDFAGREEASVTTQGTTNKGTKTTV